MKSCRFHSGSAVPYHGASATMTFSTAAKLSGVCLLALAAEVLAAYFLFSNFAYDLARTGEYTIEEAYTQGPVGPVVKVFYVLFGVTAAGALAAPLIAAVSFPLTRGRARGPSGSESSSVMPPARPRNLH
jgi:hypothetical protein